MTPTAGPSEAVRLAAQCFEVDRVTAEVTRALEAAAIPALLVKGPAISTWLYAEEGRRLYSDTDLLVRGADWDAAIGVLAGLGFEDDLGPLGHPRMESGAGHPWVRRRDGAAVDLHRTLFGIGAPPDEVWTAFSTGAVRERVAGVDVSMPARPARLLHIALHAVQHGGEAQLKPMADLERALVVAPEGTWGEAAQLAARLDAREGFAAGLALTAEGRDLAVAIGAGATESAEAVLRIAGVPLAEGLEELARTEGVRRKLSLLARELFPNPAFMRWWTPLARRGPLGLSAAYAWRLVWLAYRAIPGYRAWRRAQASGRRPRDRSGDGRSS